MGLMKGKGNSHRKKEVAALQCGALRLRCCGNGGNLLEWGGARESTVPFIIRYCRPEAVNDNDARARRGEAGQAGRDEPRRDWQGHRKNARSLWQLMLSTGSGFQVGPLTF